VTTLSDTPSYASKKTGLAPGTLVHVGEVHEHEHSITLYDYNESSLEKRLINSITELLPYKETNSTSWVIVDGLKDIAIIDEIGKHFAIHPLVLEDILNTHQRPKFEEFTDYLYIVVKALTVEKAEFEINYEQISLVILNKFVFLFREKQNKLFEPIIARLDNNKSQLRYSTVDYLAYSIMDTIVDDYFVLQDELDELLENVEDELLLEPSNNTLMTIQKIKRELIFLRRAIAPLRELLSAIRRSDSPLLSERTRHYFSDVYDHALRVIEAMDAYRDLSTGMLDIYLSSVSNKMNETMKVLTIFTTIFTPLTFIAGVYGMNFQYMPELTWHWGYAMAWGIFIGISLLLLLYFKRKKWL
jgi:magnesium transporter